MSPTPVSSLSSLEPFFWPTPMKTNTTNIFNLCCVQVQLRQFRSPIVAGELEWYLDSSSLARPHLLLMLHSLSVSRVDRQLLFFIFVFYGIYEFPLKRKLSVTHGPFTPIIAMVFFRNRILALGIFIDFISHARWRCFFLFFFFGIF